MKDGAPGRAVVLRSEPTRVTTSTAHTVYRLTLDVHYGDGTTAEIVRTVTPFEVRDQHSVGDVLPVRYDPADHTDVDVDVPALRREQQAEDERIAGRRVAAARASLADPPPSGSAGTESDNTSNGETQGMPDGQDGSGGVDGERLTSEWLERLMRLKVGHSDGVVGENAYATGLAAARAGLRDGTAVFVTGDDADYVIALAAAIIGDPVPGDAEDVANAERAAGLLETIVRLKTRHESGELDETQLHAAMAAAGRAVQEEAERLG